jgi:hypothetical protein
MRRAAAAVRGASGAAIALSGVSGDEVGIHPDNRSGSRRPSK